VNGQGAATSIGFFPPQVAPDGAVAWRGPRSCAARSKERALERETRSVVREGCSCSIRQPRGEREEVGPKGPPAPEDQVNHIPVRRIFEVAP